MNSLSPIRMVDMGRNIALAGKTVSTNGVNITYDADGYVDCVRHYSHKVFEGTQKSVRAASIDAVLNPGDRSAYGGSVYDKQRFSNSDLASADNLRRLATEGVLSKSESEYWIDEIRRRYGYTGGSDGNQYIAVVFPDDSEAGARDTRIYADAPAAVSPAPAAVEAEAAKPTAAEALSPAPAEKAAAAEPKAAEPVLLPEPSLSEIWAAPDRSADAKQAETERIKASYQEQLESQRQRQALLNQLDASRLENAVKSAARIGDTLTEKLLEEDEKES